MIQESFHPYDKLFLQLEGYLPSAEDGAHDLSHLQRVWQNAKAIQKLEGGDLEMLAAAVLLHDCVQVPKDSPLRSRAAALAADQARIVLKQLEWQADRIDVVAAAIESHSYSAGVTPTSLEGSILQDADRLDAIGYVGIARCFYTAGRMGSALYHPNQPEPIDRLADDKRFALDHFPKKLLILSEGFRTPTGKRLAKERHTKLQEFYTGMLAEIAH
ncbi:HD domain-containing protein [Terriglobus albidus]|uniref:HD domain-containing protein n=1 Tax=Terriglobus albidus TaxID=1592106 RepID=UPI0021E0E65A|nr:HD domain-containing protein [Terriglobus albidus]